MKQSLNKSNYLKSISLLGEQIKQSYNKALKLKLPPAYRQVNKVVVCAMGGSQLGVDLISSLFKQELKVPIIQVRDYSLPGFINEKTLVLLISYSGTTEEVLTVSKMRGAKSKAVVITIGGELAKIARKNNWPIYQFNPLNNPSGQPRMGTGYTIGSVLAILQKLNLIKLSSKDVLEIIKSAKVNQPVKNQAAKTAGLLKNKVPIIITSEHLTGNAHIIANQINESAKQRCYFFALPELNHHLLEGLSFPKGGKKHLFFIFLFSKNYYSRNQRRFKITEEVLKKQKIAFKQIEFIGGKISQAFQALVFGSLLSYQLAKINKVNPNSIPWVDYLKNQLKT